MRRIIKVALDVTRERVESNLLQGRVAALNNSQLVADFTPEGRLLWANEMFLDSCGYRLDELVGQPSAIFWSRDGQETPVYRQFWEKLRSGLPMTGNSAALARMGMNTFCRPPIPRHGSGRSTDPRGHAGAGHYRCKAPHG
ncbi:hypothetical protein ACFSHQ_12355 [Gemmobacter lanyuensis]